MERPARWRQSFEKDVSIAQDITIGRPRVDSLQTFWKAWRKTRGLFRARRGTHHIPANIENSASQDTTIATTENEEETVVATRLEVLIFLSKC
jgi:hypothetical protein